VSRVYLDYFGLEQTPFAITPDPAFVFLSPRHQDALAHLLYGVGQGGGGGFVQLTGEVGTGKTTLCRCLLEQIPENCRIALILNPALNPAELVTAICDELSIDTSDCDGSLKLLVDRLNRYLLEAHASGQQVVVVIDEAQNLSRDALEQVRLLTNLETDKAKLLQIVLLGQPELRDLLARDAETASYVRHRLAVAGCQHSPFSRQAIRALFRRSGGVPRLINIIADRALVAGYAADADKIGMATVHTAANEVRGTTGEKRMSGPQWVLILTLVAVVLWGLAGQQEPVVEPVVPAATEAVEAAVPEPVVSEPEPDLEPVPTGPPPLDSEALAELNGSAWAAMAGMWGRSDDQANLRQLCLEKQGSGFTCLRIQGSWNKIRQLGLPVILELPVDESGYALLAGFNGRQAILAGDGRDVAVSMDDLENYWLGTFLVVWPQADDWPRELSVGDSGTAVVLVKTMASELQFSFSDPANDLFDEPFKLWIQAFQRRSGLLDDGIIGPETLVYLMAPGIANPRLQEIPASP
jgi:general secretion pathway protein A